MDLNLHATIKKIKLINMLGSIPHQKFCFYHLPTWGRVGINLGVAWYVSNIPMIFIVPCYYIIHLGCFICIYMLFYMIFGTNQLTYHLPILILQWLDPSTMKKITWINMLGSIPHQKFCFYHLPTWGWAGIKHGDADMSPTYL